LEKYQIEVTDIDLLKHNTYEEPSMIRQKCFTIAAVALCLMAIAALGEAKEYIFNLGYSMVSVVDSDTDEIVADIPVNGWTREAGWTKDKKFLYVTSKRHLISKIDLQQMKVVSSVDINQDGWQRFIFGFMLDDSGKTAWASLMTRKTEGGDVVIPAPVIAQIDLETGKILRSVEVPLGVAGVVKLKNKDMVYAVGKDLYKIDTSTPDMKIVETYSMFDREMNVLVLWPQTQENGDTILVNYYGGKNADGSPKFMGLLSVDGNNGESKEVSVKGPPVMLYTTNYSNDRKKVYGVMDDLVVIDLETSSISTIIPIHEGTQYGVFPSEDGKKIYAGAGGSTMVVYDAETVKPIKVIQFKTDGWALAKMPL